MSVFNVLPGFDDVVKGATDMCKIKEFYQYGFKFKKEVVGATITRDVWPGWGQTTYVINPPLFNFTNPASYQECQHAPQPEGIQIFTPGLTQPEPIISSCCNNSYALYCCVEFENIANNFKPWLTAVNNIMLQYTPVNTGDPVFGKGGSEDFCKQLRDKFTNSCQAVDKAIDLINEKNDCPDVNIKKNQ